MVDCGGRVNGFLLRPTVQLPDIRLRQCKRRGHICTSYRSSLLEDRKIVQVEQFQVEFRLYIHIQFVLFAFVWMCHQVRDVMDRIKRNGTAVIGENDMQVKRRSRHNKRTTIRSKSRQIYSSAAGSAVSSLASGLSVVAC